MEAKEKKPSKIGTMWLNFIRNHKKAYRRLLNMFMVTICTTFGVLLVGLAFLFIAGMDFVILIAAGVALTTLCFGITMTFLEAKAMPVAREEMVKQFCPKDAEAYRQFLKEYP